MANYMKAKPIKPIKRTLAHRMAQLEAMHVALRRDMESFDSAKAQRISALESAREVIDQVLSGHGDRYNRLHTRLLRLEQVQFFGGKYVGEDFVKLPHTNTNPGTAKQVATALRELADLLYRP